MELPKQRSYRPADLAALVGRQVGTSEWMTVTQDAINRFGEATGDTQWIHTDPERARRESPYGSTIAHGFLTLSLLGTLFHSAVHIDGVRLVVNYGLNRVRFPAPVRANSLIRAVFLVRSHKDVERGCEVAFDVHVEGEGLSKPCCIAEWILRFYE
ncbi:MAG: MaoC family dehydratase [Acidobacteria bacterium]|nr:MaoC family dehydratase [Acidobacteriota bacterium]